MLIVAVLDVMIDKLQLGLDVVVQGGKRFFDWRKQDRQADFPQDLVLVLPARVAYQVIFESTKLGAVVTEHVARLERVTQQAIHEEFVSINVESFLFATLGAIQVGVEALWNERCGKCGRLALPRRFAIA
ncbi:hypothetical protein SBC1_78430 (plasmid) [Caballeronia sp. SBC1]|nr:hypothetical protein SBC1_78430 [Caballeronia sp. SBC1]